MVYRIRPSGIAIRKKSERSCPKALFVAIGMLLYPLLLSEPLLAQTHATIQISAQVVDVRAAVAGLDQAHDMALEIARRAPAAARPGAWKWDGGTATVTAYRRPQVADVAAGISSSAPISNPPDLRIDIEYAAN